MPLAPSKRQPSVVLSAFIGLSFLPALGLGAHRLADWALFTGGMAEYDVNAKFVCRILQACTLLVIAVLDRRIVYSERTIRVASVVAALISTVAAAAVIYVDEPVAILACAGLRGVSQTVMMVGWGYWLCSTEPRQSVFALTLGFALSGIVSLVFLSFPPGPTQALALCAAPASALCLICELTRGHAVAPADEPLSRASLRCLPVSLMLLLLACTLTGVFVHTLVPTNQIQQGTGYQSLTAIIYLVLFACCFFWVVVLGRHDAERLWPLFPAIVLGGLVCYTSFIDPWPQLAMNILTATQNCTILFCWLATAATVYRRHLPRVFSFCVSNLVFAEPITLSITFTGVVDPAGRTEVGLATIAVTLLFALALVVLTTALVCLEALKAARTDQAGGPVETAVPPADPLVAAVASMAEDYALTEREQEVALYLARGYTFPETAEAMHLSLDTVRSHVKCLYRKTDVHKKGRLIELIEERRPDLAV